MKSSANVVGRRLRRYLSALLAAGFGVTWWSFVPPAAAAVVRPPPAIAMARELVELRWSMTAMEPAPPPPIVKPEPRVYRPKPPIVVVADPLLVPVLVPILVPPLETPTPDPIVVPDPQVVLDDLPAIRTRSSR